MTSIKTNFARIRMAPARKEYLFCSLPTTSALHNVQAKFSARCSAGTLSTTSEYDMNQVINKSGGG
jgi:hypothetical protein